jgi:uncharacterized protein (TIGR03790 family)
MEPFMLFLPLIALAFPTVRDVDRVVVVKNLNSTASVAVADDYMKRRGVKNVVTIKCKDSAKALLDETTQWKIYKESIEKPISDFLGKHPEVDFIVLTKGIPIRISDAPDRGMDNHQPCLDNTLAALGYDTGGNMQTISFGGRGTAIANHFFSSTEPFSHTKFGGYLVTRLDGYTVKEAQALTTRALAAEKARPTGKILLDISPGYGVASMLMQPKPLFERKQGTAKWTIVDVGYADFNGDILKAADILKGSKIPCELNKGDEMVGSREGLMGYVSWGSNDKKYDEEAYHSVKFAPGGICETAVSSSGRTFLKTSGGQSLIADLLVQGATGAKGYTDEPFIIAMASSSILFERYTRGWTLAESYYAASRFVGWEDIVIGDPICRPYRK